jgi:hypothetical protein
MDPGYDIMRDYSMSAAQVFTLFAKMLIERGHLISVLMCLASEKLEPGDTRLPRLPSWVPDLRRTALKYYYRNNPDIGAKVSLDTFLICDVRCMGSIERVGDELDEVDGLLYTPNTCLQVLRPTGHLHEYELSGLNKNMQRPRHKDLLCSLLFESSTDLRWVERYGECLLVLREQCSSDEGRTVYQLITCGRQRIEMDQTWPRITVCIA